MQQVDHKKIRDVMLYITKQNGGTIQFKKLLKLVFLSDRLHLRKFGRTLSTDDYYAMGKGPVATMTYDTCKQITGRAPDLGENGELSNFFEKGSSNFEIKAKDLPDLLSFSMSETKVLDQIYRVYGQKSGSELSDITHGFHEWKKYEDALRGSNTSYRMSFDDFFATEDTGTIFEDSLERLGLVKELFHENNASQIRP